MQPQSGTPSADSVAGALEQYLAAVEAGTAPPRQEFLARHPELAEDLDACLAALRFIGRAAQGPRSEARQDISQFSQFFSRQAVLWRLASLPVYRRPRPALSNGRTCRAASWFPSQE
jgi:hypothetical protein